MASRRPLAVHIGIGWGPYIQRAPAQCSLANYAILKTALSPIGLSVLGHRISATDIGSGDFGNPLHNWYTFRIKTLLHF